MSKQATDDIAAAYDDAAAAWSSGAARVYNALARGAAGHAGDVRGARLVDIGAGTGALGAALLARGAADVVAVDLAAGMLHLVDPRIAAVLGDATSLPFADGEFDLAATAFCFSHLDEPAAGFAEARRVAGALLSVSFDAAWTHPAKAAVDEVLAQAGHEQPHWYARVGSGSSLNDAEALLASAHAAGYRSAAVRRVEVDTGICDPEALASWRLTMAHNAACLAGLDEAGRARLRRSALSAVAGMPPLVVPLFVLTAS